jgi:hypothetical protein
MAQEREIGRLFTGLEEGRHRQNGPDMPGIFLDAITAWRRATGQPPFSIEGNITPAKRSKARL